MPAVEAAKPLTDCDLDAVFAPIAGAQRIVLAVSGGADSLALLIGVARWRRRNRGVVPRVLTVDHGLRAGSGDDAKRVVAIARDCGMAAERLVWCGPPPKSGIEAAARTARYRLLIGAARRVGASHLLLAHHLDDQAETVLMRLQRGAGVFGLAAMRPHIGIRELTVFRPFLRLPRARLAATTAAAGLVPVEDPMNTDLRFHRARIRRVMPLLAAGGLDAAMLAEAASRMATAADAIDAAVDRLIADAVLVDELAVAALDRDSFALAPEEVRRRLLVRLVIALGGEPYPPRFDRLKTLHDAMVTFAPPARFKRTLAGTIVEWRRGRFLFYREIGRNGLPVAKLTPGCVSVWDNRFEVALSESCDPGLTLGPLGENGRVTVAAGGQAPTGAIAALPAVRREGTIVAVPSLSFRRETADPPPIGVRTILAERLARPPLFPDFGSGP